MESANEHKAAQNTPPDKALTRDEMRAIELRYEGKTFKEIAAELDMSENTLRNWFAPAYERLYPAYLEYADRQNEVAMELAQRKLKGLIGKAVDAIGELVQMADKDSTRLSAAEGVLERALGKVTQNVNLIGTEQLKENLELLRGLSGFEPNANDNPGPDAS